MIDRLEPTLIAPKVVSVAGGRVYSALELIVPSGETVIVVPSGFTMPATDVVAIGALDPVPLAISAVVVPCASVMLIVAPVDV